MEYSSENLNLQIGFNKFVRLHNTFYWIYKFHSFTQSFNIKYCFGKDKKEFVDCLWFEYRILFFINKQHMRNLIVFAKTVFYQVYSHPSSKFITSIFPSALHDEICFLISYFFFYFHCFWLLNFFRLHSDL